MNLFVAKLNPATTANDLHKLFSNYGGVTTVKVIVDPVTGQSKSCGIVEMPVNHEAHEALTALNNKIFHDQAIEVKAPKPNDTGQFEPEYLFHADSALSPYNNNGQSNKYNSDWTIKPRRDNGSRNYGYRGSGFPYFK